MTNKNKIVCTGESNSEDLYCKQKILFQSPHFINKGVDLEYTNNDELRPFDIILSKKNWKVIYTLDKYLIDTDTYIIMKYNNLYTDFVESEFYIKSVNYLKATKVRQARESNIYAIIKTFIDTETNKNNDVYALYYLFIIFIKEHDSEYNTYPMSSYLDPRIYTNLLPELVEYGININYIFKMAYCTETNVRAIKYIDKYMSFGISHDILLDVITSLDPAKMQYLEIDSNFVIKLLNKMVEYGVDLNLLQTKFLIQILLEGDNEIIHHLSQLGVDFTKVNYYMKSNMYVNEKIKLLESLDIDISHIAIVSYSIKTGKIIL